MPKEVYSTEHGNIKLYTADELSEILGIASDMVALYIQTGEIKGKKIAGAWYVPEDVIEERRKVREAKDAEGEGGKGIISRILSRFR